MIGKFSRDVRDLIGITDGLKQRSTIVDKSFGGGGGKERGQVYLHIFKQSAEDAGVDFVYRNLFDNGFWFAFGLPLFFPFTEEVPEVSGADAQNGLVGLERVLAFQDEIDITLLIVAKGGSNITCQILGSTYYRGKILKNYNNHVF